MSSSKRPISPQESTSLKRQKTRPTQRALTDSQQRLFASLDPMTLRSLPQSSIHTITDIIDVLGDGNCGFRALAVALGRPEDEHAQVRQELLLYLRLHRQELLDLGEIRSTLEELNHSLDWDGSNCLHLEELWLAMPDCGRLIAQCYNRAFVCFNAQGGFSFFPAREPTADDVQDTIYIIHVGGHYMAVQLNAIDGTIPPPPFAMIHSEAWIQLSGARNNDVDDDHQSAHSKEIEEEGDEDDDIDNDSNEDDIDNDSNEDDIDNDSNEDDIDDDSNEDDIDDDSNDDGDDLSYDHRFRKIENHLPRTFVRDRETTNFNFYLGVKASDGFSCKKMPEVVGFAFKSFQCVYLAKFLLSCGVKRPKFGHQSRKISETYNAGYLSGVTWSFRDQYTGKTLKNLGFPSSKIANSQPAKIRAYFADNQNKMAFIVFVLGFFLGDGSLHRDYIGGGTGIALSVLWGLEFSARDKFILRYMEERFKKLNCKCHLSTKRLKSKGNKERVYDRLNITCSPELMALLEDGILELIKNRIPLDSKLALLYEYVKAYPKNIPLAYLPPRALTFHEFLGPSINDPVACVIAQDLFDVNLHGVNMWLEVLGIPRLLDIYDFELDTFVRAMQQLAERPNNQLNLLQLVVKHYYLHCVQNRAVEGLQVKNKSYKKPLNPCLQCEPITFYSGPSELQHHVQQVHEKKRFKCNLCPKDFESFWYLRTHKHEVHVKKNPDVSDCPICKIERYSKRTADLHYSSNHDPKNRFPCPVKGCLFRMKTENARQTHIREKHDRNLDTRHKCPVGMCKKRFQDITKLDRHVKLDHRDVPDLPCTISGCPRTFGTVQYRDQHVATDHKEENQFQCPHCKAKQKTRRGYNKHLQKYCNILHKKNSKKGNKKNNKNNDKDSNKKNKK